MSTVQWPVVGIAGTHLTRLLECLGLALLYWLLAQPVMGLASSHTGVIPLWPSSGLGIAVVVLLRGRAWFGVFIGAFAVGFHAQSGLGLSLGAQLFSSLGTSFGNTLEVLFAFYVLRHYLGDAKPFSSLRGFWVFLCFGVAGAAAISALIGVSALTLIDMGRSDEFAKQWLIWWIGDMAGILLIAPLIFGVVELRHERLSLWRALEALAMFVVLAAICLGTFELWKPGGDWSTLARPSLLIPILVWAVLRFRLAGTSLALLLSVVLVSYVVAEHSAPLPALNAKRDVLMLQSFIMLVAVTAYCLVAVLNERDRLAQQLKARNAELSSVVDIRSSELALSNEALKREVAERQQIAWELSASEEKLRLILEQASEAIVLIDAASGRIVECNRVAHERLGYSREQFVDTHMADHVNESPIEPLLGRLERIRSGGYERFDAQLRDVTGSLREVHVNARHVVLRGEDYLLAALSDITELKVSELRLKESEFKHRQVVENLLEGIWVLDAEGHTTFVNARMAQMLGHSVEEMQGKHLFHFMAPDQMEACRHYLRRRSSGISEEHEFTFLRRDGRSLTVHISSSPLFIDGIYAGAVAGVVDIGYMKRVEADLRESERRLLQVIDLVPHMLFARDRHGRYLMVNKAMSVMIGKPVEAILGRTLDELTVKGIDIQQSLAEDQDVLASGQSKSVPQELFIDAQGRERIMQITKIPFTQAGSSEPAVLGISIDITEQRRGEQLMAGRNLVLELIARGLPIKAVLEELLRLYESLFPELRSSALLVDKDRRSLSGGISPRLAPEFMSAIDGLPIAEGVGCCGHAAYSGELTVIEDVAHHPYTQGFAELAGRFQLRACWSMPIRSAFGEVLGTFAAYAETPSKPTDEQISVLRSLSQLAAVAIDRRERELVLTKLKHAVDRSGSMILITDAKRRIEYANQRACEVCGYSSEELLGQDPIMFCSKDVDKSVYEEVWQQIGTSGDWRGELRVQTRDGTQLWLVSSISPVSEEGGRPRNYVFVCEDVTAIKQAHDEMQQLAFHDTLTGLENRRLFKERLEHAVHVCERSGRFSALLFLDLDKFKTINDTLGHEAGDKLLQTVATRLLTCVRQEDCVARLGGDEFTVLLKDVADENGAVTVAEKIIEAFGLPIELAGQSITTGTSIGIALMPRDGHDSKTLMQNADTAMYQAKASGRGTWRFYRPSQGEGSVGA